MSCPKCSGLLIPERIYERWESHCHLEQVKCINCGFADDPQMQLNRRATGSSFYVDKRHNARVQSLPN